MRARRDMRRSLAAGARAAVVVARRVVEREQLQVVADRVALRERALRALELVACARQKVKMGAPGQGVQAGPAREAASRRPELRAAWQRVHAPFLFRPARLQPQ